MYLLKLFFIFILLNGFVISQTKEEIYQKLFGDTTPTVNKVITINSKLKVQLVKNEVVFIKYENASKKLYFKVSSLLPILKKYLIPEKNLQLESSLNSFEYIDSEFFVEQDCVINYDFLTNIIEIIFPNKWTQVIDFSLDMDIKENLNFYNPVNIFSFFNINSQFETKSDDFSVSYDIDSVSGFSKYRLFNKLYLSNSTDFKINNSYLTFSNKEEDYLYQYRYGWSDYRNLNFYEFDKKDYYGYSKFLNTHQRTEFLNTYLESYYFELNEVKTFTIFYNSIYKKLVTLPPGRYRITDLHLSVGFNDLKFYEGNVIKSQIDNMIPFVDKTYIQSPYVFKLKDSLSTYSLLSDFPGSISQNSYLFNYSYLTNISNTSDFSFLFEKTNSYDFISFGTNYVFQEKYMLNKLLLSKGDQNGFGFNFGFSNINQQKILKKYLVNIEKGDINLTPFDSRNRLVFSLAQNISFDLFDKLFIVSDQLVGLDQNSDTFGYAFRFFLKYSLSKSFSQSLNFNLDRFLGDEYNLSTEYSLTRSFDYFDIVISFNYTSKPIIKDFFTSFSLAYDFSNTKSKFQQKHKSVQLSRFTKINDEFSFNQLLNQTSKNTSLVNVLEYDDYVRSFNFTTLYDNVSGTHSFESYGSNKSGEYFFEYDIYGNSKLSFKNSISFLSNDVYFGKQIKGSFAVLKNNIKFYDASFYFTDGSYLTGSYTVVPDLINFDITSLDLHKMDSKKPILNIPHSLLFDNYYYSPYVIQYVSSSISMLIKFNFEKDLFFTTIKIYSKDNLLEPVLTLTMNKGNRLFIKSIKVGDYILKINGVDEFYKFTVDEGSKSFEILTF